jgi:gamma-glutamyltranspeptidase/glutathione hydrolase
MTPSPLQLAFGRAPEPWLDFDATRARPVCGRAAAATANPLASWAALTMLRAGGAAIDGAIAAQAVLTVVEPNASGIGGGAMIVLHDVGATHVFDGLTAAPARVPERLETDFDGRSIPAERAVYGGRTVGVPGVLRALDVADRRFGRLPWARLFEPAVALAEGGFPLAPYLVRTLQEIPPMRDEAMARSLYCGGTEAPLPAGTRLHNIPLARALQCIAEGGADAFYQGELAERIARAAQADHFPGTITAADLADYRAVERPPVRFRLGRLTVVGAPLPAFGCIAVGQIIGIAARLGFGGIGREMTADEIHILAEAGRIAFADRARYADPDFAPVDGAAALDAGYLDARAALLDRRRRTDRIRPGRPDALAASMTSHIAVADAAGQVVSMTTTINQNFGARIAVDGFYLNNVLTNFAADPVQDGRRVPNAMTPHKRPRTTIAPAIVLDEAGRPVAAIGAGGGYRIIGYVANGLLRLAGGETDPQALLAAPHALNWNGISEVEPALERHAADLIARGHWLAVRRLDGGTQCLLRNGSTVLAGGDPRRDGAAMAIVD